MRSIQRVAVLGSGTMGSRIAAHFSNAGIPVILLDLAADGPDRNALARKGIENALKQKPTAFFVPQNTRVIQAGNFEDDLPLIRSCQWVIEAVTENLDIKRAIWSKVDTCRAPDAILSTNTSGIPLAQISRDFDDGFQRQFLGAHFFNPPRYLHLLEVIPGAQTDPGILHFVTEFGEKALGKGVVLCKDTPNFIANRIGSFFGSAVVRTMMEGNYTIEEVDALTGPLIGLPKSASFRLFDIIGLDVWAFVAKNLYEAVPGDPWREWFVPPPFLQTMIEQGWIGEKRGQGFYKRVGPDKQIHAIDWKTFAYHPVRKASFESVEVARTIPALDERIRKLVAGTDRAGSFLWKVLKSVFLYSTEMVGEISDRIVEIDRAMRWGYGHKLGPFEFWDALGFNDVAERMLAEETTLPESIQRMRAEGARSFYRPADRLDFPHTEYFDLARSVYQPLEARPGVIVLGDMKRARGVVEKNAGASLIDIGNGVLCLEFHSKMNAIGEDALRMIDKAIQLLPERFDAMVIANEGENFSVGANLVLLLTAAQAGEFDELEQTIDHFQQCMLRIKYAPRPVVAAVFSRALGGGCEIVLQSHAVQASAETYIGLVEVGVGLIPAAGGCKEMTLRFDDSMKAFELIGQAKVSGSAVEARQLGFLRATDRIGMNPELLIGDAKELALQLARTYRPGFPRTDIPAGGDAAYAKMRLAAWSLRESGMIGDHDFTIGEKLAFVLSGGRVTSGAQVSEQNLLDLEREAFLSLCGMSKTQERIQYMLKTGKPLRN
ncbi:MAG TPA: 3-hydroxyacyl-CoA dehydrogenase/enoyl-CoA hydratase family protein [Bryobacteraceae bacterium]|nr:3-hydroxyacyl-CoA dehydrogenase/enoyl-CoA hydratase family protein [Bryobacteraceae bacterium]